jgi:hypothetical protein
VQTHLKDGAELFRARGQRTAAAPARALAVLLIVLELLQVVVFLLTDADGVRVVSVVVTNAIGAALLVVGRADANRLGTALGLTAIAAPWLLRLLADPVPAVAGAALLGARGAVPDDGVGTAAAAALNGLTGMAPQAGFEPTFFRRTTGRSTN